MESRIYCAIGLRVLSHFLRILWGFQGRFS